MNDASPKLTARQQQAVARREQILSTAVKLFGTQGFAGTTTRQIAQAAGITEGLIFRYFPTKVSILQAISKERDSLAQAFAHILQSTEGLPVPVVMERVATAWMTVTRSEMNFMSMLISEGQINRDVRRILHGAIDEAVSGLAQYLEPHVKTGEIRPNIRLHTAATHFFAALLLFFITHHHLDDGEWNEQASTFITDLVDTWLRGTLVVLDTDQNTEDQGGGHGSP